MSSVFLLGELEKKLSRETCGSCPTAFLVLPNFHSCFYLTNRFHVAVHLSSNNVTDVRTSVTHSDIASCATFLFLPRFDVLCDLLLDRCTATWNLFVLYNKEINFVRIKTALFRVRRAKVGPSPF